jgi:hypothetical protein
MLLVVLDGAAGRIDRHWMIASSDAFQTRVLALILLPIPHYSPHPRDEFNANSVRKREECFHFFAEPRVCGVSTFTKRQGYAI